jgi:aspartate-semialdehyde dehydrogenase
VSQPLRVALLGALDPLGEAVIALLDEEDVTLGELIPLALDDCEEMVTIAGEALPVEEAAGFDWGRVDLLIAATRHAAARRHVEAAANQGCAVICPGNDFDARAGTVIRVPTGLALAAARALKPIAQRFGLASTDIFAALPVSMAGRSGVEELARQTQSVFAMEEAEPEHFPVRIAFNLIPQTGHSLGEGEIDLERMCSADLRAQLGLPELPVLFTAAWAPIFYGNAMAIHSVTDTSCSRVELVACLENVPGITLMDEAIPGGVPTPYTESQDSDTVFIGRLRADAMTGRRFALWLVSDATRLEAARIVETLEIGRAHV